MNFIFWNALRCDRWATVVARSHIMYIVCIERVSIIFVLYRCSPNLLAGANRFQIHMQKYRRRCTYIVQYRVVYIRIYEYYLWMYEKKKEWKNKLTISTAQHRLRCVYKWHGLGFKPPKRQYSLSCTHNWDLVKRNVDEKWYSCEKDDGGGGGGEWMDGWMDGTAPRALLLNADKLTAAIPLPIIPPPPHTHNKRT